MEYFKKRLDQVKYKEDIVITQPKLAITQVVGCVEATLNKYWTDSLIPIRVGPRQNNDSRESENGQPWKNWNCQNHSQYCLIANFVHEIGDFAKNRKINVTINTNI